MDTQPCRPCPVCTCQSVTRDDLRIVVYPSLPPPPSVSIGDTITLTLLSLYPTHVVPTLSVPTSGIPAINAPESFFSRLCSSSSSFCFASLQQSIDALTSTSIIYRSNIPEALSILLSQQAMFDQACDPPLPTIVPSSESPIQYYQAPNALLFLSPYCLKCLRDQHTLPPTITLPITDIDKHEITAETIKKYHYLRQYTKSASFYFVDIDLKLMLSTEKYASIRGEVEAREKQRRENRKAKAKQEKKALRKM